MRYIQNLVDNINEEIKGAKDYAETYLLLKSRGEAESANRYKEMANDELKHTLYIHDRAAEEIDRLNTIYTAPEEMQQEWEKAHAKYVEKVAWIRQMMGM